MSSDDSLFPPFCALAAVASDASRSGRTPLHTAANFGNLECVKLLVESNASLTARTRCSAPRPLLLLLSLLYVFEFVDWQQD
jgi:ankyrin repeat protein